MRNLILRVVVAAGLSALTVLPGTTAHAGFAGMSKDCAVTVAKVTVPKFDSAYFKNLREVWSSSDGVTGVFFLRSDAGTVVVKFEPGINTGAIVSRRVLKALEVPSDTLIAEFSDAGKIRGIFNGIVQASGRNNVVAAKRKEKFDERIKGLKDLFDGGTPPRQVVVTQFINAYAGAPSLGAAIKQPNDIMSLVPAEKISRLKQLLGGAKALGSPHNQRFLGYLYIVDTLLGNNDRLLRSPANWNNIFLAAGENGAACLVAIDNEAHAPTGSYLAMLKYAVNSESVVLSRVDPSTKKVYQFRKFGQTFRFQTPADPPNSGVATKTSATPLDQKFMLETIKEYETQGVAIQSQDDLKPAQNDTFQGEKRTLSAQDYLETLMGSYQDKIASVNTDFFGPKVVFEATHLDKWNANFDKSPPSYDTCQRISDNQGPGTVKPWVRRLLRMEASDYIAGMMETQLVGLGAGLSPIVFTQQTIDGVTIKPVDFAGQRNVCKSVIDVEEGPLGPAQRITIDWAAFDQNFQDGVTAAMNDIRNLGALKPVLTAAFKGMPNFKTTDVHVTAMTARASFMARLAAGEDINQIIANIRRDEAKEFYAKPADLPATTYVRSTFRDQSVWLPK